MKKIYISHKYGNKKENKDRVQAIIKELVTKYHDYLFISPIHALGFLYDDVDYEKGMEYCLELLSVCDEMWVCSEDSRGVLIEKEYCKTAGIPCKEIFEVIK